MRRIVLFLFVVCVFQIGMGQAKNKEVPVTIVSHQVQLGETVRMISKKYLANPTEIYRLNKFAVNGISEGMVLQIPVPIKDNTKAQQIIEEPQTETAVAENENQQQQPTGVTVIDRDNQTEHTVQSGETLSGLSRKYGISIAEIKMSNDVLNTKGLKIGQVIKIPSTRVLGENESSIGSDVVPANEIASTSKTKNKK
ncbi:hypothetical protein FNO01nite_20170 [Flavobacterium noncentrifugens]|uniref:LysM repeat-containing protein n=1 Tax=Flavobacterium noncentrifugens TaxID=1128970 RepID=A0A1G8YSP5_9FLAO|nr:LysM peptidoglycan-binding domain-containing protein [Flavobacterium noncentrifugens]GEP51345.1 hypothetical protein FNO01nite_20170 [Flavobacterium noncentrifugens]SDK05793.1 LysM repeat-containing protein [Flavobacterium noncentrifugens]